MQASRSAPCFRVYDVTKFLDDHHGGDEVLLSATGKDATDDFEDVGHSTSARAMMEEYYIGNVDPKTLPSKPTYTPAKQDHYNPDKTKEFVIKILQFVVPLGILALAVAVFGNYFWVTCKQAGSLTESGRTNSWVGFSHLRNQICNRSCYFGAAQVREYITCKYAEKEFAELQFA